MTAAGRIARLPAGYREAVLPLLPDRAFLRRDRGDALFVTNAPAFADADALCLELQARGFLPARNGGRLFISPGPALMTAFERAHPDAPDFLCRSLLRFREQPPCEEALSLFARGARLLENADAGQTRDYTRRVRQLAAMCLRTGRGGCYGCALIAHALICERSNDT